MRTKLDVDSMARDLEDNGMNAAHGARYDAAFRAAKVAAVVMLCASYGADAGEVLDALVNSQNLNAEVQRLAVQVRLGGTDASAHGGQFSTEP